MKNFIKQKEQGLINKYELLDEYGLHKGYAESRTSFNGDNSLIYSEKNRIKYLFRHAIKDRIKDILLKNTPLKEDNNFKSMYIYNNEKEMIGTVTLKYTGKLFQKYGYYELDIKDEIYKIYTIGVGKKGKKHCVYAVNINGFEEQIGLINEPAVVKDAKILFDIYILNVFDEEVMNICALYLMLNTIRTGEIVLKAINISYSFTTNKELKNKYEEGFIDRC